MYYMSKAAIRSERISADSLYTIESVTEIILAEAARQGSNSALLDVLTGETLRRDGSRKGYAEWIAEDVLRNFDPARSRIEQRLFMMIPGRRSDIRKHERRIELLRAEPTIDAEEANADDAEEYAPDLEHHSAPHLYGEASAAVDTSDDEWNLDTQPRANVWTGDPLNYWIREDHRRKWASLSKRAKAALDEALTAIKEAHSRVTIETVISRAGLSAYESRLVHDLYGDRSEGHARARGTKGAAGAPFKRDRPSWRAVITGRGYPAGISPGHCVANEHLTLLKPPTIGQLKKRARDAGRTFPKDWMVKGESVNNGPRSQLFAMDGYACGEAATAAATAAYMRLIDAGKEGKQKDGTERSYGWLRPNYKHGVPWGQGQWFAMYQEFQDWARDRSAGPATASEDDDGPLLGMTAAGRRVKRWNGWGV